MYIYIYIYICVCVWIFKRRLWLSTKYIYIFMRPPSAQIDAWGASQVGGNANGELENFNIGLDHAFVCGGESSFRQKFDSVSHSVRSG